MWRRWGVTYQTPETIFYHSFFNFFLFARIIIFRNMNTRNTKFQSIATNKIAIFFFKKFKDEGG